MLTLTYSSDHGQVEAIYNGRFIVCPKTMVKNYELDGARIRKADNVFHHEEMHRQIFFYSPVGMALNGMRVLANLAFTVRRKEEPLRRYYQARAIYFYHAYAYQEIFAATLESHLKLIPDCAEETFTFTDLPDEFLEKVRATEKMIVGEWKDAGVAQSLLPRWFAQQIGKWIYRDHQVATFDPIVPVDDQAGTRAAEETGKRKAVNPAIRLRQFINAFEGFPDTSLTTAQERFSWFQVAQRSQFEVLQARYGLTESQLKAKYLHPLMTFALQCADMDLLHHHRLYELAEDAAFCNKEAFLDRWYPRIEELERIAGFENFILFFIIHGN